MANFEPALEILLKQEGGLVRDKSDPGGETNFGVSLRWLKSESLFNGDLNHDGHIDSLDIESLNSVEVARIYKDAFWSKNNLFMIRNQILANMILSFCVNLGSVEAIKCLQQAANDISPRLVLQIDGGCGPKTIRAINGLQADVLITHYQTRLKHFYLSLVKLKPELGKFLKGWLNRVVAFSG